jgi:hypothetical protein
MASHSHELKPPAVTSFLEDRPKTNHLYMIVTVPEAIRGKDFFNKVTTVLSRWLSESPAGRAADQTRSKVFGFDSVSLEESTLTRTSPQARIDFRRESNRLGFYLLHRDSQNTSLGYKVGLEIRPVDPASTAIDQASVFAVNLIAAVGKCLDGRDQPKFQSVGVPAFFARLVQELQSCGCQLSHGRSRVTTQPITLGSDLLSLDDLYVPMPSLPVVLIPKSSSLSSKVDRIAVKLTGIATVISMSEELGRYSIGDEIMVPLSQGNICVFGSRHSREENILTVLPPRDTGSMDSLVRRVQHI